MSTFGRALRDQDTTVETTVASASAYPEFVFA